MSIRVFCTALSTAAVLTAAPPALSETPNAGGAEFRFQVFEAAGDLVYRVMEEKFCEDYGLECRGVRIGAGPAGIQALIGNSLEASVTTTDAAVRAITGGAPVKIIHGIGDRVPFYLVARSGLERPNAEAGFPAIMEDLEGKRIGVTGRGAGTELIARLLLRDAGMSADDVTFVGVGGPPTAFGSLASNQIDAAVMIPPLAEICDRSDICETLLYLPEDDSIDSVNALNGSGIVSLMSQEYIDNNPEVVEAFLAAVQDTVAWIHESENLDELNAIAQKHVTLRIPHADEILREAVERHVPIVDEQVRPDAIEAYVDMLYDMDLVAEKLPVDQLISNLAPTPQ
ncbi:ABC transporter substrate-binding protein [Vreelandella sp. EE27]